MGRWTLSIVRHLTVLLEADCTTIIPGTVQRFALVGMDAGAPGKGDFVVRVCGASVLEAPVARGTHHEQGPIHQ